ERVFDHRSKLRSVPKVLANLMGPMADAQDESPRALIAKQADLDLEKRSVADGSKSLRPVGHDAPQPCSKTSRQNDDRAIIQRRRRGNTASSERNELLTRASAPQCMICDPGSLTRKSTRG